MIAIPPDQWWRARCDALRTELADLAFELECQGRCDAADIANHLRLRLAEFAGERHAPASFLPNPENQPS
jgi:hypothetical protein